MIFINRNYLIATIVIIIILLLSLGFLIYCAFFAYRMNAQLDSDDTEKKDFAHLAPWLRPATPRTNDNPGPFEHSLWHISCSLPLHPHHFPPPAKA